MGNSIKNLRKNASLTAVAEATLKRAMFGRYQWMQVDARRRENNGVRWADSNLQAAADQAWTRWDDLETLARHLFRLAGETEEKTQARIAAAMASNDALLNRTACA